MAPLPLRKEYVSSPYRPCAWPCDLLWPKGCYRQDMHRGLQWVPTCAPMLHQEKSMALVATALQPGPRKEHVRWLVPDQQQISWRAARNRATRLNPASSSQRVTLLTREHEESASCGKPLSFGRVCYAALLWQPLTNASFYINWKG